eukprot:UN01063
MNSIHFYEQNDETYQLLFKFPKGNPVPFIEAFPRRQQNPPQQKVSIKYNNTVNTHFTLSTEICFDLMFPDFSRILNVDLMLHPSYVWSSFVDQFLYVSSFRAIENGYNIFQCSYQGNTAVINQYGQIVYKRVNYLKASELKVVDVPIISHNTFYQYGGFIFDYICLVLAVLSIIIFFFKKSNTKHRFKES